MHLLYVTQKIQKNVRTTIKREVVFSKLMLWLDEFIFGVW